MLLHNLVLLFAYIRVFVKSLPTNNTGLMISSYSKVSHWSNTGTSNISLPNEGRSNSGQMFYTQSTDAKVSSGQNLRSKNLSRRINKGKFDPFPGVGEVQERFNPRPYFDYTPDSTKENKPSYSYDKPFDSFPTFGPPLKDNNDAPLNTYGSPYTSYNPLPDDSESSEKPENMKDVENFRPTVNYDETMEYDTPPPSYNTDDEEKPKNVKDTEDDHNEGLGPEIIQTVKPPGPVDGPYFDYPPKDYNYHHPHPNPTHFLKEDMENQQKPDDDMDLNPPPPSIPDKYRDFYSDHSQDIPFDFDHHHHVYHEIKTTTTTTPAPVEDERVNKGHYSYYYLGRKLWYIPLYFSVYFIVYITILILKSIARHKVSFVQHFDNKRTSRNIDINDMEMNVNKAIYSANEKYMM